jgi:hypothetical protein
MNVTEGALLSSTHQTVPARVEDQQQLRTSQAFGHIYEAFMDTGCVSCCVLVRASEEILHPGEGGV